MRRPTNILFVLTDGGHARFVARSADNGHFETLSELRGDAALRSARHHLHARPPGRAFAGNGPQRSAVGPEDSLRRVKDAFMGEV
ncbi:MAG: host attachment protein, partial [Proteobacteria bacterium]|nr:host attachment protein [Pseudomonadota bacterium]